MSQSKTGEHFDFFRPALRLGVPVAIQNLLLGSFGLIDMLIISPLGDTAVSSVGMAAQWGWLMGVFFYGISSGAAVFLSQYWGAKDLPGIRRAYGMLTVGCLSIATLMGVVAVVFPTLVMRLFTGDPTVTEKGASFLRVVGFSYIAIALSQVFSTVLRSTEEVKLPMFASFFGVIANTLLNYGFVFGNFGFPKLGIPGSALATVISAWISPVFLFLFSLKRRNMLICPPRALLSFDGAFVRKYVKVSLPVLANEMVWSVGTMGYGMVFGHIGTLQYTAYTIFRNVETIFFSFYVGLCHACGVLVGREIGAGRVDSSVRYAKCFAVAMPALSAIIGLLMLGTGGVLLRLFDVSEEAKALARTLLLVFAVNIPIRNIAYICICGVFRPAGDTRTGLLYDGATVWLIALPLTICLGLVLNLPFIWVYIAMLVSEDWIKALLCIRRFRSKKWIKPVVQNAPEAKLDEFQPLVI